MTAFVDISHFMSGDIAQTATGDMLPADTITRSNQRILRRLLTNPGAYIWQPDYGAGLPARIGAVLDLDELTGLIRSQMALEASVAHEPEPQISLQQIPNGVKCAISYTLADTNTPASLNFSVTP